MKNRISLNTETRLIFKSMAVQHGGFDPAACRLSRELFRVVKIERQRLSGDRFLNDAVIIRADATLRVAWEDVGLPGKVHPGEIVSPRFGKTVSSDNGSIRIQRLAVYQRPEADTNLFDLVPAYWVKDRALVRRAGALLTCLPCAHRFLFNAIFWDPGRFERFCRQPASMAGHHAEPNGNLRHTVEVAETVLALCQSRTHANPALGVLAALLHDAGKADEYVADGRGGWTMSERGRLLGHKVTAVEWIVEAATRWNIRLPRDHYESLLHIMTAIPHAPEWMGLRAPMAPESLLLSVADRLSGHDDLMARTVNREGGFGRRHRHLEAPPYTVKNRMDAECRMEQVVEGCRERLDAHRPASAAIPACLG